MRNIIVLCLILFACYSQVLPNPTCPNGNLNSDIFSAQVTFSLPTPSTTTTTTPSTPTPTDLPSPPSPSLTLTPSKDLYTYTYILPLPFRKTPSIAISINSIQSTYSSNLNFYVRYIPN